MLLRQVYNTRAQLKYINRIQIYICRLLDGWYEDTVPSSASWVPYRHAPYVYMQPQIVYIQSLYSQSALFPSSVQVHVCMIWNPKLPACLQRKRRRPPTAAFQNYGEKTLCLERLEIVNFIFNLVKRCVIVLFLACNCICLYAEGYSEIE